MKVDERTGGMNMGRAKHLIERAVRTFALDLSGNVVLTEAATGWFALTPLIAAIGGAERVYAITRDSSYGTAHDVRERTLRLADVFGVAGKIEILESREDERLATANIITNLGFVRPLHAPMLRRLHPSAVIPLMWEPWEWRAEDLDLRECRELGIPVLGTDEDHASLRIFQYIGPLAAKLTFEADVEIFRSRILVVGGGRFATEVVACLRTLGAETMQHAPRRDDSRRSAAVDEFLSDADALVVVEHHERSLMIGPGGRIDTAWLATLNPDIVLVHICGAVDGMEVRALGIRHHPAMLAPAGYMSASTAYLGPRPLIDLHTAGLKVGQVMAEMRRMGLRGMDAERATAAACPLAQMFEDARIPAGHAT